MLPRARIAIVGLGVAGTTAATLLARQGHRVSLFEQTASPGPVGAGVLLQPSGQLILERLGLLEQVTRQAEPIAKLFAVTHRGRTLIDLPYAELAPGTCAYGLHRGVLFTALFDALRETPATLHLNIRATSYKLHDSHVSLLDGTGTSLGDFDFLLAADGAKSALRAASSIPHTAYEYPHGALWSIGKCSRVRGQLWQVARGSRQMCGLLPMGERNCSLFWSLNKCDLESVRAKGFGAWRDEVLRLCPEAAEHFESITGFDQTMFATYLHVRMPRPFDARCLFLGDAAHAMSPHLGQGINLALLDAYCFAEACTTAGTFREACERYLGVRRDHVRVYAAVTYLLSPFFQSPGRVKGLLRDMFLPWMPRVLLVRREMIRTMAGMRANLFGGTLKLD